MTWHLTETLLSPCLLCFSFLFPVVFKDALLRKSLLELRFPSAWPFSDLLHRHYRPENCWFSSFLDHLSVMVVRGKTFKPFNVLTRAAVHTVLGNVSIWMKIHLIKEYVNKRKNRTKSSILKLHDQSIILITFAGSSCWYFVPLAFGCWNVLTPPWTLGNRVVSRCFMMFYGSN